MSWNYTVDRLAAVFEAQRPGDMSRITGVSTDTRTLREGDVFFALKGENFDANDFLDQAFEKGAVAAVAQRHCIGGVVIQVQDSLAALQQFAAHHRARYAVPVIAITGSCGKTTSKDLTAAVLSERYKVIKTRGNLNNEIGGPLTLLQMDGTTECAVMEMGANHRGEIERLCAVARPTESAITMVGEAHLEGFGTIEDVAAAKAEIMTSLPHDGVFYINVDDPRCRQIGARFPGKTVRYGSEGDVILRRCEFASDGRMQLAIDPIGELTLPLYAKGHATNVLLAVAIGLYHGISEFQAPLERACKDSARFRVFNVGGIEIIDDTYNANPGSVRLALDALAERNRSGKRIAVLGEMLELGPQAERLHREVGEYAGLRVVECLFARGEHAACMVEAARGAGVALAEHIEDHAAMAEAVAAHASPGDVVLVKGSRGTRMEKVVESLKSLLEHAPQEAAR